MTLPKMESLKLSNAKFTRIVGVFQNYCMEVLGFKKEKYSESSDDRLIQFRLAAALLETNDIDALRGMMVKHTTKMYRIINKAINGELPTVDEWMETAGDQVNYIYLLTGLFFMIRDFENDQEWMEVFMDVLQPYDNINGDDQIVHTNLDGRN